MAAATKGRRTQKDRSARTERSSELPELSESGQDQDRLIKEQAQDWERGLLEHIELEQRRNLRRQEGRQSSPLVEHQVRSLRQDFPFLNDRLAREVAALFYGEGR
jgi:hypothetical protein